MTKADKICSDLKIKDVMEFYGVQFNNRGYAVCPFHNEKTPSLKTHGNRYKCFGCGASGGVIDFVMKYHNINFLQAIVRLDSDFQLGLSYKKPTYREQCENAENRLIQQGIDKWQASLQKQHQNVCTVHRVLYDHYLKGELWLENYLNELSELLDTFNPEEVRAWPMIFKT